jgi:opacity protein-like surface antigen
MGGTPSSQTTTQRAKEKTTGTQDLTTTGTSTGTTSGTTAGTAAATVPEWLMPFITQATGAAGAGLGGFAQGVADFQVPQLTQDVLEASARGDYLYGGPQQQAFIDAAVRAAQPGVYSAFGAAGRAGSGLERAALDQTAVDAFARLFQSERGNQLAAAQALPGLSMMPLELQSRLATLAGGLPGQFAPFLGRDITGTEAGTSSTSTTGRTLGETTGTSSGTTRTTQPLYETPWWQTALGAGTALAGLAMPGLGGASALGNIGSGLFGSTAMSGLQNGGLLGLFR